MGKRQPKVPMGSRSRYENKLRDEMKAKSGNRLLSREEIARLAPPKYPKLHDYQLIVMDELMSLTGLKDAMESDPWERSRRENAEFDVYEMYGGRRVPVKQKAEPSQFVEEGDWIEALQPGSRDKDGLPEQVPERGKRYRIERFYLAPYGIGVVLRDEHDQPLDPYPYRGYIYARFKPIQGTDGLACMIELMFKKVKDDAPITIEPI
jgi:hypothetical protein